MVTDTLSNLLGIISIACWLGAQFPQVLENVQRQSCEGISLPFLANWLLGDASNLVGCILTHQLPFQKWLAVYFVFVDLLLVLQYFYYGNGAESLPAPRHIRPSSVRRKSVDRSSTPPYRAVSAVSTAAVQAPQEENGAGKSLQRSRKTSASHRFNNSEASASKMTVVESEDDVEDVCAAMANSFHAERGWDNRAKGATAWSSEHNNGRARSVDWHGGVHLSKTSSALRFTQSPPYAKGVDPSLKGHSLERYPDLLGDMDEEDMNNLPSRWAWMTRKNVILVIVSAWVILGAVTLVGTVSSGGWALLAGGYRHILEWIPLVSKPSAGHGEFALSPSFQLRSLLDERIIGRVFAWLCTSLYLTSRIPQILKNYHRKSVEGLSMYLFVFAFLGNIFYVSSIALAPQMWQPAPESSKFISESIPYLLGSAGTLLFDVTIVLQSFLYRKQVRRVTHSKTFGEESGLLAGDALSAYQYSVPQSGEGFDVIASRGRTLHSQ